MVTDDQITLYVIGAMDAREAAAFERQVAASAELRQCVAVEKAAVSALLMGADSIAPPAALKDKLMARIDADVTKPVAPTAKANEQPRRAGLGDIWRYIFSGLSAGFAALALVLGIGLVNTQSQVGQLQTQLTAAQNASSAANAELQTATARAEQLTQALAQAQQVAATAQAGVTQSADQVASARTKAEQVETQLASVRSELAVLNQSSVRMASLPANKTGFESGAIHVFYSPDGKMALITVANLPKLAADKTYQVWLIKGNECLPSSIFNVGADGSGRLVVQSDEPFSVFQNLGITIEPTGGRPTPNPDGPIYLGALS